MDVDLPDRRLDRMSRANTRKRFSHDVSAADDFWPDDPGGTREHVRRTVIDRDRRPLPPPGNDADAVVAAVDRYGDDNAVHVLPGFGRHLAENLTDGGEPILPPAALSTDGLVMQGGKEFADAVRAADIAVESATADYNLPVDSEGAYEVERADGEVTVRRPDLPDPLRDAAGPAAEIALDGAYDEARAARRNAATADHILDSLSHAPYEGHILLDSELRSAGPDDGCQEVHVTAETVADPDGPYDVVSTTFAYDDGTEIAHTTMRFDRDAYAAVLADYAGEQATHPMVAMAELWGDAMVAGAEMQRDAAECAMDAYRAQTRAFTAALGAD